MFVWHTGALLWTYVTAKFCDALYNTDPVGANFRNALSDLNRLIKHAQLPTAIAAQLREYHVQTMAVHRARARTETLKLLSPELQHRVYTCPGSHSVAVRATALVHSSLTAA